MLALRGGQGAWPGQRGACRQVGQARWLMLLHCGWSLHPAAATLFLIQVRLGQRHVGRAPPHMHIDTMGRVVQLWHAQLGCAW